MRPGSVVEHGTRVARHSSPLRRGVRREGAHGRCPPRSLSRPPCTCPRRAPSDSCDTSGWVSRPMAATPSRPANSHAASVSILVTTWRDTTTRKCSWRNRRYVLIARRQRGASSVSETWPSATPVQNAVSCRCSSRMRARSTLGVLEQHAEAPQHPGRLRQAARGGPASRGGGGSVITTRRQLFERGNFVFRTFAAPTVGHGHTPSCRASIAHVGHRS
jgi:hypothetical protein